MHGVKDFFQLVISINIPLFSQSSRDSLDIMQIILPGLFTVEYCSWFPNLPTNELSMTGPSESHCKLNYIKQNQKTPDIKPPHLMKNEAGFKLMIPNYLNCDGFQVRFPEQQNKVLETKQSLLKKQKGL